MTTPLTPEQARDVAAMIRPYLPLIRAAREARKDAA